MKQVFPLSSTTSCWHSSGEDTSFKEGRMVAEQGNQQTSRELQMAIRGMKGMVAEGFLFPTTYL